MTSGLTLQSLRSHRGSLAGPVATQTVGAAVISVMMLAAYSVRHSLTPAQLNSSAVHDTVEFLNIFTGNARFLSVIVIGITMNLAMARQMRDIVLMRSIGSSPAQARWNLVRQAAIVSVPASVVGFLLAVPACAVWLTTFRGHGAVPDAVSFHLDVSTLFTAMGVELVASVVGTLIASVRASRMPPVRATAWAARGASAPSRLRTGAGLTLVGGGITLSVVLSMLSASVADAAGIFVLLGESLGVGLLAPWILQRVTRVLRRVGGGTTRLALDDVDALSRQLAGALIPLVLAISFAAIQNGMVSTAARAAGSADAATGWMTLSGSATTVLFAAVAAVNCLITMRVSRAGDLATMQVTGGSRDTLLRMAWIQTLVVAGTALAISTVIAVTTLVPISHTAYDTWIPYLPPWTVGLGVVAVVGLVAVGLVAPTSRLTRRNPMRLLRADA